MKPEYQLVSNILASRDAKILRHPGLDLTHFQSPECAVIVKALKTFALNKETYGHIPSPEWLKEKFPAYPFSEFDPNGVEVDVLVEEINERWLRSTMREMLEDISLLAKTSPREALAMMGGIYRELDSVTAKNDHMVMDAATAAEFMIENYALIADTDGMIGIPYPWEPLNTITRGMQGGEYIQIYAPPKSMKTWVANEMAVVHPFLYGNARCLGVSAEMPISQMYRRVYARFACLDYEKVITGTLAPHERSKYQSVARQIQEELSDRAIDRRGRNIRFIKPDFRTGGGINSIRAQIEEFEPDIVFIDGVYLLRDDRGGKRAADWKSISHITQDLKAIATEYHIPVVTTTQANRSGMRRKASEKGPADDMAFSTSAVQDADILIRANKIDTDEGPKILMQLPAVREFSLDSFLIRAIPAIDFSLEETNVNEALLEKLINSAEKEESEPTPTNVPHKSLAKRGGGSPLR